jgi:phosphoglycolate phosphatase-like HAD superfamily hydrolase
MIDTVVLDLDGTLRDWDGSLIRKGMAFAERHHQLGHALAVVTLAAEPDAEAWLAANFTLPFIGPFCRPPGDRRNGPLFKYDVACQLLQQGFNVVGAAEDDAATMWMWQRWARWYSRRTSPATFDLLKVTFSRRQSPGTVSSQ